MGLPKNNRRNFIKGSLFAGVTSVSSVWGEDSGSAKSGHVKFSVFADIHHYPGVFRSQTPEHLIQIQKRAVQEHCDFIIHVGDFTHNPSAVMDFVDLYNNFKIPSYHVLGNHDQDGCGWQDTLKAYRMKEGHYFFDKNGFRFIILDPNYILQNGTYTHYSKGNYYKAPSQSHPIIPPDQLKWLKETVLESNGPCIMFSHQSYERETGGILNWREIRKVIDEANLQYPGRVRLCINGHYHRDFLRILNNVVYFDLNSASYDWVEKPHNLYPEDLCKKIKLLNHTVAYEDPIHAVITLDLDGSMKIDGMESRMFMDVTREKAKLPLTDSSGRPVVPKVQSANFKFLY